jgi:type II secretory pathway component PulF
MAIPATLVSRPVTLEQLSALSDEIAALVRAGVPLNQGLRLLSQDLPGRLGKLAGELGQRLEAGEPLDKVLANREGTFPPEYRAVIEAGLRAGRLPAALEGVAHTARRISQLRTSLGISLLYPLIVLLIAWGLFSFGMLRLLPVMFASLVDVMPVAAQWAPWLERLEASSPWWRVLVPTVVVLASGWIWFRSGQVAQGIEIHPLLSWGGLGTWSRMQRAGRQATLSELLALLISNDVPLAEAVELATAATGSRQLTESGRELASRIRQGETAGRAPRGFSPLLAWTLTCGNREQLFRILKRSAQLYRDEFNRRGQWISLYVPLFATGMVAAIVVVLYGIISLGPWILIMHRLGDPLLQ